MNEVVRFDVMRHMIFDLASDSSFQYTYVAEAVWIDVTVQ
jgi:hypothetical protein